MPQVQQKLMPRTVESFLSNEPERESNANIFEMLSGKYVIQTKFSQKSFNKK
jgi:hypothetical protein